MASKWRAYPKSASLNYTHARLKQQQQQQQQQLIVHTHSTPLVVIVPRTGAQFPSCTALRDVASSPCCVYIYNPFLQVKVSSGKIHHKQYCSFVQPNNAGLLAICAEAHH